MCGCSSWLSSWAVTSRVCEGNSGEAEVSSEAINPPQFTCCLLSDTSSKRTPPPRSSNELVAVWLVQLLKSQRVNLAFFWNVKKRLNVMVVQWTHSITVSVPGTHPIPRKSAWRLSCASSLFHLFTSRLIYFPWCVAQMKLFTCI